MDFILLGDGWIGEGCIRIRIGEFTGVVRPTLGPTLGPPPSRFPPPVFFSENAIIDDMILVTTYYYCPLVLFVLAAGTSWR